jgi:hypothetical protein
MQRTAPEEQVLLAYLDQGVSCNEVKLFFFLQVTGSNEVRFQLTTCNEVVLFAVTLLFISLLRDIFVT